MQFTAAFITAILAATASAAVMEPRALNKANEYKSNDCSGKLNYGHHGDSSRPGQCINMDVTTHSVYIAKLSPSLTAYSAPGCGEKDRLGGADDHPPCKNLDNSWFPGVRVGSVKFD
ncbi:hypothetical protein BGZ60DRAFT_518712 [Tricladium varicosporioides]|nr:hypothetical protein BGZ60DRAFT_518712 [Hymenoscyphus varicosporioides]